MHINLIEMDCAGIFMFWMAEWAEEEEEAEATG